MNRWRVGEDRGSKEKDRCPLTLGISLSKVRDLYFGDRGEVERDRIVEEA
jgi:hypothetical protein